MNRLKRAREMAELSLGQAARLLGWPKWMLERYESGTIEPTSNALRCLADAYGVSVAYLRGEDVELPESTHQVLREVERTGDRTKLTEVLTAIQGRKP